MKQVLGAAQSEAGPRLSLTSTGSLKHYSSLITNNE